MRSWRLPDGTSYSHKSAGMKVERKESWVLLSSISGLCHRQRHSIGTPTVITLFIAHYLTLIVTMLLGLDQQPGSNPRGSALRILKVLGVFTNIRPEPLDKLRIILPVER